MLIIRDKFTLRNWLNSDAESLAEVANNKKTTDKLRDGFPHPYTIEDARKWIEHTQSWFKKFHTSLLRWSIYIKQLKGKKS
jgi:hypothetical protein